MATIRKVREGGNSRERGDDCRETRAEEVGKKKKRKVHRQRFEAGRISILNGHLLTTDEREFSDNERREDET